nr:unnamed protein product [Callosobruchus analis]
MIRITENKIFCSPDCEEKTIDDSNLKLLEEIESMKTEVLEKERYIARLQKTAKDFENDVIEIEQKFVEKQNHLKEQLTDQKEQLYLMHTEMLKVKEKNKNYPK